MGVFNSREAFPRPSLVRTSDYDIAYDVMARIERADVHRQVFPRVVRDAEGSKATKGRWKACVVEYSGIKREPEFVWNEVRLCVEKGVINILGFGPQQNVVQNGGVVAPVDDIKDIDTAAAHLLAAYYHKIEGEVPRGYDWKAVQMKMAAVYALALCRHPNCVPKFDEKEARKMSAREVRQKYPRFDGVCDICKKKVIVYASTAQYVLGDY